jgi:hypothetical protein
MQGVEGGFQRFAERAMIVSHGVVQLLGLITTISGEVGSVRLMIQVSPASSALPDARGDAYCAASAVVSA